VGTFGITRGFGSESWPWANLTGSGIKNGIILSYWNKTNGSGVETNGAGQPLSDTAKTKWMSLYSGNGVDLLTRGNIQSTSFAKIALDWYAMQGSNKMNIT
jgi:hypothetical protein